MPTLRLLPALTGSPGSTVAPAEVAACCYTPDGRQVLAGGWDGCLRLWDTAAQTPVANLKVSNKPVSACAVSPDAKQWLAGSLDGMLSRWDAETQKQLALFLAHTRPISSILFGADGQAVITASWDRTMTLWSAGRGSEGRHLKGHSDIVAGCRFTADGRTLLSWSHDSTLRLWDVSSARQLHTFTGHTDRLLAGAVSSDASWAASGSRDGSLRLWDLQGKREVASYDLDAEIRGCFFLLDAESLVLFDTEGTVRLLALPELELREELITPCVVECGALAPSGNQLALGCRDGLVRIIAVEGCDSGPLVVTATQTSRRTATAFQKFLGKSQVVHAYHCTCPACRSPIELPSGNPQQPAPCPNCQRPLRVSRVIPEAVGSGQWAVRSGQ